MKKCILFLAAVLCFSACKTDLTDIEKRIEEIEKDGKDLEQRNKDLQDQIDNLKRQGDEISEEARRRQEENEKIQQRIKELGDSLQYVEPFLYTMDFVAADNPYQLIENTPCTIIGDSAVECRILNITDDKVLIPRFTYQGSVVTINGVEAESGKTVILRIMRSVSIHTQDCLRCGWKPIAMSMWRMQISIMVVASKSSTAQEPERIAVSSRPV